MAISFSWDDFPEQFDNSLDSVKIQPAVKSIQNHIFIQGDNYPVLYHLQKEFSGKIDFIYIDPPYNTGNKFIYNDDFATNSDKHSKWLSFMNRRLQLAKNLLAESGCIFIAIGQEELFYLKILCDTIFGEENFVNDFMWLVGKGKKDKWSRTLEQHTLCYAKNKKNLKSFSEFEKTDWAKTNPDNDSRGPWFSGSISFTEERSNKKHKNYFEITSPSGIKWQRQWLVSKDEMQNLLAENKIYFGSAPEYDKVPRVKIFNEEETEIIPKNIIDFVPSTRQAEKFVDKMIGQKKSFDNPKPVELIEHLICITNIKKDALILDFFAGSGTTFEAVINLNKKDGGNRKCILVQKEENDIHQLCKQRINAVLQKNDLTQTEKIDFHELKEIDSL